MEAIVFIILQIFYATRTVLKIGEYPRIFPSFSWGIFTHVMRLEPIARERKYLMDYKTGYQYRNWPIPFVVVLIRWSSVSGRIQNTERRKTKQRTGTRQIEP